MILPARFGKYVLLKELEIGGMAAVYLAKAQGVGGFEKFLAIKKIFPQLGRNPDFVDMFISEARIAVELSHPSISHIYDLGEVDGEYFIAMEYIHGKDSYRLIKRCQTQGKRLPIPLACYVTAMVLEGLDYAHKKRDHAGNPMGIIHRDISPRNVLLSYDGGVKLIDFGIAKASTVGEHTRVGTIKGKVNYMSPEQARGEEIDARSDVFSAGLLLYELVHLTKLFAGGSEIRTLDLIREYRMPSLRETNPDLPEELEGILLRALTRDREHRYPSAQAFAQDLLQYIAQQGVVTGTALVSDFMRSCFGSEILAEQHELDVFRQITFDSVQPAGHGVSIQGSLTTSPSHRSIGLSETRVQSDQRVSFPPNFVEEATRVQPPDELSSGEPRPWNRLPLQPPRAAQDEASPLALPDPVGPESTRAANPTFGAAIPTRSSGLIWAVGTAISVVGLGGALLILMPSSPDQRSRLGQEPGTGPESIATSGGSRVKEVPAPTDAVSADHPEGLSLAAQPPSSTVAGSADPGLQPADTTARIGEPGRTTQVASVPGSSAGQPQPSPMSNRMTASATGSSPMTAPAHSATTGQDASKPSALELRPSQQPVAGQSATARSGESAPAGSPTLPSPSEIGVPVASGESNPRQPGAPATAPPPGPNAVVPGVPAGEAITTFGFINVNADTPCMVKVNGEVIGQTPLKRYRLPVGSHRIELERISDHAVKTFEQAVRAQQVYALLWKADP